MIGTLTQDQITDLILQERERQDEKWGADRNLPNTLWLTILSEEIGESARAILETLPDELDSLNLQKELIQCAAVIYAWLECIEMRTEKSEEW